MVLRDVGCHEVGGHLGEGGGIKVGHRFSLSVGAVLTRDRVGQGQGPHAGRWRARGRRFLGGGRPLSAPGSLATVHATPQPLRSPADTMLRPWKTIDAASARARLDDVVAAVRREAESAEADAFDEAMVAAVLGAVDAMKAEGDALSEIEERLGKLARKA